MMEQAAAIPFGYTEFLPTRPSTPFSDSSAFPADAADDIQRLVKENAVIVFGKRGCCMIHVVKRLLLCLGVNPAVHEIGEGEESAVFQELGRVPNGGASTGEVQFPAVFIGGKHFGGLDRVMATHITGELVPLLKEARALWL
ncbi:hypothetical protein MLD38_025872 [Melastoma candidum]|uniref:Uncharacterized protein n=1 Tax=Melastoma candidum TaxID=119954 RepID=A0ACB9NWT9_9MYRT|nr:hypothetical protein MLD38_025872 [Melastoma candidum]